MIIGHMLGHYRIDSKLGEGGMGVVYRAADTHLNRTVALKVLPAVAVANPDRKRRFIQEAKAASSLNHSNIVTIYDINQVDGVDFIAMEYVAGRRLDEAIGPHGMKLAETLAIGAQIADALAAAHAAGIVHRDIKPSNIMINERGVVKVLDFGLAKLNEPARTDDATATIASPETPHTEQGTIVGTVAYMSPEQAEGLEVDARSDVFSFGSVLYEMLTGKRAFRGTSRLSTLSAILSQDPKPVAEVLPSVPPELETTIARCLRKDRNRRFQHISDVKIVLEDLQGWKPPLPAEPARPPARLRFAAAGILLGAAVAWLSWWLIGSRTTRQDYRLTRVTSDSGLSTDAAISPDGKLVAYASDRAGEGSLDIWVQQIPGGEPLRVTRDDADDSEPAFSPDGTKIVFHSTRDGGGVYLVPALGGGESRLIARHGRRPQFSPDGTQLLYWTGEEHTSGQLFVVAASGGPPRQLVASFRRARSGIWSPDGAKILFLGLKNDGRALPTDAFTDWWLVSRDDEGAIQTGVFSALQRQGLTAYDIPAAWLRAGNFVLFSAASGDSTSLWQIVVSPDAGKTTGPAQRLTIGAGMETGAAAAAGRIVFTSTNLNPDIWSVRVNAADGTAIGPPERLTQDRSAEIRPYISADGSRLVFESYRSGNADIWLKDVNSGRETGVASTPRDEKYPVITRDGSKVAYAVQENGKPSIYQVKIDSGGRPGLAERICEDCGNPRGWSPDGIWVLWNVLGGPAGIAKLGGVKVALTGQLITRPQFSPDGRWISFHSGSIPGSRQIFIAPFRSGSSPSLAPESEWISITDGKELDRETCWSPDGNLLYFLSEREGYRCIWAQRLDPTTKRPKGDAFAVFHSHRSRLSLKNYSDSGWSGLSIARDRLVFTMSERTGNVWMMQLQ